MIEALGVQYATTHTDGTCEENFLSWEEIERVLILEAPFRMQFIFYLALQRRNPPDPQNPLIVLYPVKGAPANLISTITLEPSTSPPGDKTGLSRDQALCKRPNRTVLHRTINDPIISQGRECRGI